MKGNILITFAKKIMNSIAKEVYQIPLLFRNSINCYLVEGYVIDSGIKSSFNKIKKNLYGKDLKGHVITHAHPDHQGCDRQQGAAGDYSAHAARSLCGADADGESYCHFPAH